MLEELSLKLNSVKDIKDVIYDKDMGILVRLAISFHEKWRKTIPEGQDVVKPLKTGEQQNINVSFDKLPSEWKIENIYAAKEAVAAVKSSEKDEANLELIVHNKKLERRNLPTISHREYNSISDENKINNDFHIFLAKTLLNSKINPNLTLKKHSSPF